MLALRKLNKVLWRQQIFKLSLKFIQIIEFAIKFECNLRRHCTVSMLSIGITCYNSVDT